MTPSQLKAPELRVPYWIDENGEERDSLTLAELGTGYKVIFCLIRVTHKIKSAKLKSNMI